MNLQVKMRKILNLFFLWTLGVIINTIWGASYSSEINKLFADPNLKLPTKIDFALKMALKKYDGQKIWLIYSIENLYDTTDESGMTQQHFRNKELPLDQLIFGKENIYDEGSLAIILDYSLESGSPCLFQIYTQRTTRPFLKDMRPIFWLGEENSSVSLNWLVNQFYQKKYVNLKTQIIKATGIHNCSEKVVDFQKRIIMGDYPLSLKNEAINCLSQHNSIISIKLLAQLAIKENDIWLRKKAIFALSQIKNGKAQSIISKLAKKDRNIEIRREAIFWLSQIGNEEAIHVLSEIVLNETDPSTKEYTIFAISQLPEDKAKPLLTHIAQTTSFSRIRKKAIFWLGKTRDQRMMDFFLDLINEQEQSRPN